VAADLGRKLRRRLGGQAAGQALAEGAEDDAGGPLGVAAGGQARRVLDLPDELVVLNG
jgi:hypothetical protein